MDAKWWAGVVMCGSVGCVVHVDSFFSVEGQADGPELSMEVGTSQAFEVHITSEDWHLPSRARTEVVRPEGVDVVAVDALGERSDPSEDDGVTAWFDIDLDDPGFDAGVERSFVLWLRAAEAPGVGPWTVRVVDGGLHHGEVDASYELVVAPCDACTFAGGEASIRDRS